MQLKSGGYYEGEWLNGMRHGKGVYVSNFEYIQVWEDKTCYEGDFKNDQMHGKGKITHPNGDVYEGEWQNDMANGYGVFS